MRAAGDGKAWLGTMRSRGFTLVELLVTVAIIGVLALVAVPAAEVVMKRYREAELRSALREIRTGIDAYRKAADEGRVQRRADETGYPRTLESLVEGVDEAKSPQKRKIYFLRRIPRDPFATDPKVPPAKTWGQRSYVSPPDEPKAGEDVFDVYSQSPDKGLNGVPYREW